MEGEETLESNIKEILKEIIGDKKLEKYCIEYEKLVKALKKSHENENRLMSKCKELNAKIVSDSTKLSMAMKIADEDQATISTLQKEVDKAWKMVETTNEKSVQANLTIQKLQEEMTNLTILAETKEGGEDQEISMTELIKVKEELTGQKDQLTLEVQTLRETLAKASSFHQKTEAEKNKALGMVSQLQDDIQMRQNEVNQETRRKERLEKEVKQLQADLDSKQSEVKALTQHKLQLQDDQRKLEQQLQEHRVFNEKTSKELDQLQNRNTKLQQENEQNAANQDQLSIQIQKKASELKMKEEEAVCLKQEAANMTKMREMVQKRLRQAEEQKAEVENQRETLKNQISGLEREIESTKSRIETDKKAIDELVRERDHLNKSMILATNESEKQQGIIKLHEQTKKALEQEILNFKDEAQKQRKIIFQMEKERDRYIDECSTLTRKVIKNMEDIKLKEMEIFDYKKQLADTENKLKQQQNLYDDIRTEKDVCNKNLNEARDQNNEMKRKLKNMNHMFEQMKDEIVRKEVTLEKEHQDFLRLEREKDALKAEIQKLKEKADVTKQFIEKQKEEEHRLQEMIGKNEANIRRQKKELNQVISERDILGSQLKKRNDMLALLHEKIKIQQSILDKSDIQSNKRMEDIRLLKLEIKNQRRERNILSKNVADVDDLRLEVFQLRKDLVKERTKCQALETDLSTPLNVHRWRKLEASDPHSFELIQRINSLQRRLINKTQEVEEKELLLQEKDKLYLELKNILAQQPGQEAAEKLQVTQRTLRKITEQHKALVGELNMYESKSEEYKSEIDHLNQQLQYMKKKFFAQKRKEQEERDTEIGSGSK